MFSFKINFLRGILISSSTNALETVVHSHEPDDNTKWAQWELEDTGRAELPLEGSEETYPAGMALDLTSEQEVFVSETLILPPSPLLLLLSDHGVLCPFTVVNKNTSATQLEEPVRPPKPLPSDPRLVHQQKPVGQASPPSGTRPPCPSTTTSTASDGAAATATAAGSSSATAAPRLQSLDAPGFSFGQQKSLFPEPTGSMGFSVKSTTAHPSLGSMGQAPPHGSLSHMPPHSTLLGLTPRLSTPGQSLTVGGVGQGPPLGTPGQALPLGGAPPLGTLGPGPPFTSQKTGQASSTQQQQRQPTSGLLLGGSGTASSGLPPPSSFPFSVSSLASSSLTAKPPPPPPSTTTTTPPSSVAQQQLPQSQTQSATQQAPSMQATLIQGLRFGPGYPIQQQMQQQPLPVTSQMGPPLSLAPPVSGLIPKTVTVSVTPTTMPRSSGLSSALHTSAAPAAALGGGTRINSLNQSIPSQPGQLPIRPLQSSTPLVHPHPGLRPPAPPLTGTVIQQSPGTTAPPSRPSPPLSSVAPPLAVRMAAPNPHGGTPLLYGQSVVASSQPQVAVPSHQTTHLVGVRPPMAQKQPPIPGYRPQPAALYGAGSQAQEHGPAPHTGDDNEVCAIIMLILVLKMHVYIYMCTCLCLHTSYLSLSLSTFHSHCGTHSYYHLTFLCSLNFCLGTL